MNDPNHTDHDRALLDDLEAEYLATIIEGTPAAFDALDYAVEESSVFNACMQGNVMAILQVGQEHPFASAIRARFLEVLTKYVAPAWAAQELPMRTAATEEMVAEWREEAA